MTSETDEQFIARMEKWSEPGSDADRLFALARRGAAVLWRPIREAPIELEDGRDVLLLTMDGPLIAFWEKGRWLDKDGQLVSFITHWMPLPPPPAGEPSDE